MNLKHPAMRKAAIVVACLDQRTADMVLAQMPSEQADMIRRAILRLGEVEDDEQDAVLGQFVDTEPAPRKAFDMPGIELDGALAEQIFAGRPSRFELARENDRPAIERDAGEYKPAAEVSAPFRFLQQTRFETLTAFLRKEHPQTIAVVLSHLPAERAGQVLDRLPGPMQTDVMRRLSNLNEMDPDALADVERGLEQWVKQQEEFHDRRIGGMAAISAILDATPAEARRDILANVARYDSPLAGKLQVARRSFAEIEQLDDKDLATLLQAAEPDVVLLAMAGAGKEFVSRATRQLPSKQAKALTRALAHLGPTRLADVDDAKQALADLAARLESEGKLSTSGVRRRAAV